MNLTEFEAAGLFLLAFGAVYMLTRSKPAAAAVAAAAAPGTALNPLPKTSEVANNALPGQPGWAWRYYDDGTAIDPSGNYYYGGKQVTGR